MNRRLFAIILTGVGLFLVLAAIVTVAYIDRPLSDRQTLSFATAAGDSLAGAYYPGSRSLGVLLLEGFGSDQVTLTSLASEYARSGWHVFTFDFSGHGRSSGTLAFDNAQTDRLAYQVLTALDKFKALSGLHTGQIQVLGHSLGARVALQAATINPEPVSSLVLLGTQINLSPNVQAEFFTGTSDTGLPWVQALGPVNPPLPVLLVSGQWDDILTPRNAALLFDRLGGAEAAYRRSLVILPALVHNYEPFSYRLMLHLVSWNKGLLQPPVWAAVRVFCWIFGLAGIFLLLSGGRRWLTLAGGTLSPIMNLEIMSLKRFMWSKLLLWPAALPLAALLSGLFFSIPLGKPVFNLIYVGFIGGYGLLSLLLYWRGKVTGIRGKLPFLKEKLPAGRKCRLAPLVFTGFMLLLTAAWARTGWFFVFPPNLRLLWLGAFTPFTALGFWIGLHEAQLLSARPGMRTVLALIGLFPFFLYTLLMAALGSLSGMIGGLQGLLILWLVLDFGKLLQAAGRCTWLTASCMAVLLYWLLLPQGVLF